MANRKRYDEKCPHCLSELGSIYSIYVNHDYPEGSFAVECPHCMKPIEVFLQMEPVFSLAKYTCEKCHKTELKSVDDHYCQPCKNEILKATIKSQRQPITF